MTTEYELAVKDLHHFPLSKLKEFMKRYHAYYPLKGYSKMNKKEIIHFIATLHHNTLSGNGILDFGFKILKKAGEGIAKEVKKNVISGVKDIASTTGNLLLQNIEKQYEKPLQIAEQKRLAMQADAEKRHADLMKTMNP